MIEKPDMIYALLVTLIPAVVGCGLTLGYFGLGGNKNWGFVPMVGCVFFIVLSMWYFGEQVEGYNIQVLELIHNTDCTNLPDLAKEYIGFKGDVIDEIVLRCLIDKDNSQLALFVKENGI